MSHIQIIYIYLAFHLLARAILEVFCINKNPLLVVSKLVICNSIPNVFTDHKVYISCGEYGLGKGSWNPFIVLYNTLSECIRVLCEVQVKRRHHISLATDSFIFICGGYDKYRCHLYNTTRICLETGSFL